MISPETMKLINLLVDKEGSDWTGKKVKMAESKNEAKRLVEENQVKFEETIVGQQHTPWYTWQPLKEFPKCNGVIRIGKSPSNLRFLAIEFVYPESMWDVYEDDKFIKRIAINKKRSWMYYFWTLTVLSIAKRRLESMQRAVLWALTRTWPS